MPHGFVFPWRRCSGYGARGLKPQLIKIFKLSTDPNFDEKLIDACGLYLNPPENAMVVYMDE